MSITWNQFVEAQSEETLNEERERLFERLHEIKAKLKINDFIRSVMESPRYKTAIVLRESCNSDMELIDQTVFDWLVETVGKDNVEIRVIFAHCNDNRQEINKFFATLSSAESYVNYLNNDEDEKSTSHESESDRESEISDNTEDKDVDAETTIATLNDEKRVTVDLAKKKVKFRIGNHTSELNQNLEYEDVVRIGKKAGAYYQTDFRNGGQWSSSIFEINCFVVYLP